MVARHGWEESYGQKSTNSEKAMSYNEFMHLPYYKKYTPIDFNMIINLMKKYTDIYVILDGKVNSPEDTRKLYKEIGNATKKLNKNVMKRLIIKTT
ncbi:hypothetical protein [Lentibacillus salinarum]|uniref:Uncharacterized protein n=1 Tax=Lentibacillus salinarum TaxID=446820 RepID=A0ABW3ZZ21_9BACI